MTDLYDGVIFALGNLQSTDTMTYIESCKYLISLEKTNTFYEIVSHYFRKPDRLDSFMNILISNSQMTRNQCLLQMSLDARNMASTKYVSLQQNELNEEIEISHQNIRSCSSDLILHFASFFGTDFLKHFLPYIRISVILWHL